MIKGDEKPGRLEKGPAGLKFVTSEATGPLLFLGPITLGVSVKQISDTIVGNVRASDRARKLALTAHVMCV